MQKRILAIILALMMVLSLCACGTSESAEEPAVSPTENVMPAPIETAEPEPEVREDFVFTDDSGREVEVDGVITRIVPSGPMAQIILFALCPEMFVGLSSEWDESAAEFIPEEYYNLEYIGQLYGGKGEVNLEELAVLDPQVLIDIGEAKGSIVEDLNALQEQTGVPCVHIEATLESMPETYRTLGTLLGKEAEAEQIATFLEKIWNQTQDVLTQIGDNRAKVVYCLGEQGLNVLAYSSYHAELIDMLCENVAVVGEVSSKGTGNETDMEQLFVWNPDYIVFAPDSVYSAVGDDATWQQLSAISSGYYFEVPNGPHNWMGSPPAVQRYLGMIWLPSVLYSDYVTYDAYAEVSEYYNLFYHSNLTQEQFDELTVNSSITAD